MSSATAVFIVKCDRDAATSLHSELTRLAGVRGQKAEKKNLDGTTSEWIVLGTVALNTLPQVLDVLRRWANDRRIKALKVGDIEIKNPRPSDVDGLTQRSLGRAPGER